MEALIDFVRANKPSGLVPKPFYSREGDSLTFFFKDTPYYGERIDDFLTVYRSTEGEGLIGCQIKGLPKALALLGDFGLSISDGHVKLTMIFIACMAQSPENDSKGVYRELAQHARDVCADIPPILNDLQAA